VAHTFALNICPKKTRALYTPLLIIIQIFSLVADKLMEYDLNINQCEKNLEKARLERPPSYSIVLDNIDIMVHSADITSDNQNKDYHWCNHNAVLDRINPIEDDCKPKQSLSDTPNITFVPSLKEQFEIINDLVIMVARVLVEHFKEFQSFKNVVPKHIKHKYWEEMKKKSEKVTECICTLVLFYAIFSSMATY
jgi:hypothetical protein